MAFGLQLVPAEHHLHGMSRALQRGRKLTEGLGTAKGKPQGAVLPSCGSSFSTSCTAKWTLPTPTFITPAPAVDNDSSGNTNPAPHLSKPGTMVQRMGKGIQMG